MANSCVNQSWVAKCPWENLMLRGIKHSLGAASYAWEDTSLSIANLYINFQRDELGSMLI